VGELRERDVLRGECQQLLLVEVVGLHPSNLPAAEAVPYRLRPEGQSAVSEAA
jgi:hypothetical protein